MFNSYGWHTAMDNYTDTPRKSLILIYEKLTPDRVDPKRFASISRLCTTSGRRRLFGLEGNG
jgi:ectoine hydroxylase-related dioxygenase (phytanoyl-CoA dioxygenase family)